MEKVAEAARKSVKTWGCHSGWKSVDCKCDRCDVERVVAVLDALPPATGDTGTRDDPATARVVVAAKELRRLNRIEATDEYEGEALRNLEQMAETDLDDALACLDTETQPVAIAASVTAQPAAPTTAEPTDAEVEQEAIGLFVISQHREMDFEGHLVVSTWYGSSVHGSLGYLRPSITHYVREEYRRMARAILQRFAHTGGSGS